MARRRGHTEEQILAVLRQAESGTTVTDLCRNVGISEQTFYTWKRKYVGLGLSELRELRQLREEHTKLKRLVADLSLGGKPLKLILDRSTASYPWEMACFRNAQNPTNVLSLGVDLRLTRQFRTLLSSAPGIKPVLNRNLKVLIIADPCSGCGLPTPGRTP